MCGGVYQIRNVENGKCYIGSAKSFVKRWMHHESSLRLGKHHNRHLQAAWNRYGASAFEFTILLRCEPEELIQYEQQMIDEEQPEYNICRVAGNTLGVACGPERKAKISAANSGRKLTPEHRAKVVAVLDKHRKTPEYKLRSAEQARKICRLPQARKSASERAKARCADPIWFAFFVEASVAAKKGKPANISREKIDARTAAVIKYNKTRPITDEMRANMSRSHRARAGIELFEYSGHKKSVLAWSEEYGICRHVLRKRLNAGWPMHDALTRPTKRAK